MATRVIDVNTTFGKRLDPDPAFGPEALVRDLRCHGTACALTTSQRGIHYDAGSGNEETLEACRASSDGAATALIPVMTLDVRDTLALDAELRRLAGLEVRAVRLFAAEQDWSLSCRALRPILQALAPIRPCLIASSLADGVAALCEETASLGLPLLFLDVTYGNMAECLALMAEHRHVHAETHWLATVGAVDIMAADAGAERLLYGSGAPYHPVQKSLNQVLEADLDPGDKAAILGGNAVRLFGIPASLLDGRPRLDSLGPISFGRDTIDVHSHLGHWRFPIREEAYDPTRMLVRMRRYGITRSILSSYDAMRYDLERGNRAVAEAIQGHPELLGYVELDPHRLEASCAEMDRYYPTGRFAGCELELTHVPCPMGSEKVRALLRQVAARGKPILLKPAAEGDAQAERALALENPGLTIIHAHGFDPDWARAVRDAPNLCVEFNESRPLQGRIRAALDLLGPERVLFGTDQTLLSVGAGVGLYRDAEMSPAEADLVLHGNARRIFHL